MRSCTISVLAPGPSRGGRPMMVRSGSSGTTLPTDDARRAAPTDGLDRAPLVEHGQGPVDERARNGPDAVHVTVGGQHLGDGKVVRRRLLDVGISRRPPR